MSRDVYNHEHRDPAGFISTRAAAHTFGVTRHMLIQWASAGLITPVVTDGGGRHRWSLPQLRRQLATHLDDTPDNAQ